MDFDGTIEIDGNFVYVTVDSVKDCIDEWKIPHRAKASYWTIVFESLLFVGERKLFEKILEHFMTLIYWSLLSCLVPLRFRLKQLPSKNG